MFAAFALVLCSRGAGDDFFRCVGAGVSRLREVHMHIHITTSPCELTLCAIVARHGIGRAGRANEAANEYSDIATRTARTAATCHHTAADAISTCRRAGSLSS